MLSTTTVWTGAYFALRTTAPTRRYALISNGYGASRGQVAMSGVRFPASDFMQVGTRVFRGVASPRETDKGVRSSVAARPEPHGPPTRGHPYGANSANGLGTKLQRDAGVAPTPPLRAGAAKQSGNCARDWRGSRGCSAKNARGKGTVSSVSSKYGPDREPAAYSWRYLFVTFPD